MNRHVFQASIGCFLLIVSVAVAQDRPSGSVRVDELLTRLNNAKLVQADLWDIESQPPDPRTTTALKNAFGSRTNKNERQWIAATLLRLGKQDSSYFEFLAGYATEAIEDRVPALLKYDSGGHAIRGEFSPLFEDWCAKNGKDPRKIAAIEFEDHPADVLVLAQANDGRSRDIFRRGIASPNALVVAYCVQGLGRLHDSNSLPLLEQSLERFPSDEQSTISTELPWFESAEADRLMARFIPDSGIRKFHHDNFRRWHEIELKRVLSRTGVPSAK
ncbi:MAG TPA: hypothetical protein VKU19_08530 [Bryobacteraceae bacterium]|nr:hypothetical protein [Bryobacteraceae bacterium]